MNKVVVVFCFLVAVAAVCECGHANGGKFGCNDMESFERCQAAQREIGNATDLACYEAIFCNNCDGTAYYMCQNERSRDKCFEAKKYGSTVACPIDSGALLYSAADELLPMIFLTLLLVLICTLCY